MALAGSGLIVNLVAFIKLIGHYAAIYSISLASTGAIIPIGLE
jgi:hypothetical protein